jgi:transposase-like protein
VPDEYAEYVRKNAAGDVSVRQACKEMGISTSQWYKWQKEAEVSA